MKNIIIVSVLFASGGFLVASEIAAVRRADSLKVQSVSTKTSSDFKTTEAAQPQKQHNRTAPLLKTGSNIS